VSGHGFGRATNILKIIGALAPEGCFRASSPALTNRKACQDLSLKTLAIIQARQGYKYARSGSRSAAKILAMGGVIKKVYVKRYKFVPVGESSRNDYLFNLSIDSAMVWSIRQDAEDHCLDLNNAGGIQISDGSHSGMVSNLRVEELESGEFVICGDFRLLG
jgi:hypothetical protein